MPSCTPQKEGVPAVRIGSGSPALTGGPERIAVFDAHDEAKTGPVGVDCADLVVHEACCQPQAPNVRFGYVGGQRRGPLGPRDPHAAIHIDRVDRPIELPRRACGDRAAKARTTSYGGAPSAHASHPRTPVGRSRSRTASRWLRAP